MEALVTVVIVNWNGAPHLRACLLALAAQTERRFVAVVVDNASTDGSQAMVAEMNDARFRLLQLPANTGFAHANNAGVREVAATPWVALLNPDAFPLPDWLAKLLEAAKRQPAFAMFGSHLVSAGDHAISDGTGDSYNFSGRAFRRDHGVPVAQSSTQEAEVFAPCAAAALYSRAAWEEAGGLDADFFCYMEDVDLAFRMRLLGHRCLHVPSSVCYHVGSATTGRRSDFSGYYGQRNLVWAFVKNMPSWLFWALLPAHLFFNLLAVLVFAANGQLGVVLRAKRDALSGLPAVWRKRTQLQARCKITVAQVWSVMDKSLWPKS